MRRQASTETIISGTLPAASSPSVIAIAAHGSATAFTGLAQGKCDIGAASRRVKPDEVRTLSYLGDMTAFASEHVVGLDGVAVIVNSANPLASLSVAAAPFSAAIIFLRDQPAMPGQQGLGRNYRSHLSQKLASQSLSPHRQSAALVIVEA